MAVSKERYKDLNHALKKLRVQIMDGIPYAQEACPAFDTPKECFDWLKARTTYKKDPKGTELFQTIETLLEKKYNMHGIAGAGDCDCFTIAFLTLLVANGLYDNCGICLVGRNPIIPVHIYAFTDHNADREYADLTNKVYNVERFYPYRQHIFLKIHPLEEKQMILQLADNSSMSGIELSNKAGRARRKKKRQLKKELKFNNDIENLRTTYDQSVPDISPEVDQNYTYLPDSNMHVRNDMYDDMSVSEFQNIMLEEGVSPAKILELSGGRAARKMVKAKGKVQRKQTNTQLKTRVSGADKAATRMKLFDKAGNLVQSYLTTKGGKPVPDSGGSDLQPTTSKSSFQFPEIPTPVYIGLGVLVAGGIAYKMFKK